MQLPERVTIVEVGPGDGLRNEPFAVPTDIKIGFVDRLSRTGLDTIEPTAISGADRVPQLDDADEILAGIGRRSDVRYPVAVADEAGLGRALAAGVREVTVVASASEAVSRHELGHSIADRLEQVAALAEHARAAGVRVRGSVTMVCGCPLQGEVPVDDVSRVAVSLFELGCDEVSLGDTIGVGTVGQVQHLLEQLAPQVLLDRLAVHMHDTYGQGLANTLAAFEAGVSTADTSAGGLGGCPFARGASGNLATEDLVYALEGSGVVTGVDLEDLLATTAWLADHLGQRPRSRVARAVLAPRDDPGR